MKLRFTIRDALISTAVIAIGVVMLVSVFSDRHPMAHAIALIPWFASGSLIGAAVFNMLNDLKFGVAVGLLVQSSLLAFGLVFERCLW
jgi:hypothetical protein